MNSKIKNILLVVGISAVTTVSSMWGYNTWQARQYAGMQDSSSIPFNYASFRGDNGAPGAPIDFTAAANAATPAVVHIKTLTKARKRTNNLPQQGNPFGDLFGDDDPFGGFFSGPRSQTIPEQRASGSGVLISQDGYIVTNNHVVDGADEVKVTLANKKSFTAKVIGTDPNTDLAVIKINGSGFPYLVYGNSDDVKLGQWVLAIGYPLTLDVTVTAGIISAKSRSIGLNKGQAPVDSYLQTDAAVNPGNSGGALVNTNGELIGINSAIASPTGSYAGYSYAIPVNIVKKSINDLIKYGAVQRGYLGLVYLSGDPDEKYRKANNIPDNIEGVYVSEVQEDGAAKAAGLQKGDVITKIDGTAVSSGADLTGIVASHKPGDKLNITYLRNGKAQSATVVLKNNVGSYAAIKKPTGLESLGAQLTTIDAKTAQQNNIRGGVQVKGIGKGALQNAKVQEGFIITSVNGQPITKLEELKKLLNGTSGLIKLEGVYPGNEYIYGYPLRLNANGDSGSDNDDDDGF